MKYFKLFMHNLWVILKEILKVVLCAVLTTGGVFIAITALFNWPIITICGSLLVILIIVTIRKTNRDIVEEDMRLGSQIVDNAWYTFYNMEPKGRKLENENKIIALNKYTRLLAEFNERFPDFYKTNKYYQFHDW